MAEEARLRVVWSFVRYCHITVMEADGGEKKGVGGGRRGGGGGRVTNEARGMNERNEAEIGRWGSEGRK